MTYRPFENGVMGIMQVDWWLKLVSPLTIRNGQISAFKQSSGGKGRGTDLDLEWENPKQKESNNQYSQITDFNYHFVVKEDSIYPEYHIPASSIRGALRNAAIKRLVKFDDRNLFLLPNLLDKNVKLVEKIEKQIAKAKIILKERRQYWFDILSLFGNVFDIDPDEDDPLTWAGRLRINTAIPEAGSPQPVECIDQEILLPEGPRNVRTQAAVRNPLDRVTMGAKEGGLHSWLEMSEGEEFNVTMQVLNPTNFDIQILNLWREDINDGFIRFGALTQLGRGKVFIAKENYRLFISRASSLWLELDVTEADNLVDPESIFDQLWSGKSYSTLQDILKIDFTKLTQN